MALSSVFHHLVHPLTYTDALGETRHLSLNDMSRVTKFVLSSLALTVFEAFYSSRPLQSSFVSIGTISGAVFYLATAVLKRQSSVPPENNNNQIPHAPSLVEDKTNGQNTVEAIESKSASPQKSPRPEQIENVDRKEKQTIFHEAAIEKSSNEGSDLVPDSKPVENSLESLLQPNKSGQEMSANFDNPPLEVQEVAQEQKLYLTLALTDTEAKVIYKIIDTIGNTWLGGLYFKEKELLEQGNQIEHLHPLKFLETVLNNPHLKKAIRKIEDSTLKWRGFLDGHNRPGFVAKWKREDDAKNLVPYIDEFCKTVKVNPEKIRHLIENKNWEEFIRFLVKN